MSAVILSAAQVKEKARIPLRFLQQIPSQAWNEELQRFFDRIRHDEPSLTGKKLFTLSRSLLFNLLAVIITYEVVLLEFSGEESSTAYKVDCSKAFVLSS